MAIEEPKILKFTNFDKVEEYIQELGYIYKSSNTFKEDRSFMYQKPKSKNFIFVKSTFDFLDDSSMDMGTVWTLQQF